MTDALIALEAVDKRYPNGLLALQAVNLRVVSGELVTLVGPSGCGKSTVLRLVAGLDTPSQGRVDAPAWRRSTPDAAAGGSETAFVFQEPTLMPWASVFDNVWLPLRLAGVSRADAAPRILAQLNAVGLGEFAHAYPSELSGGMKMRTSIARALVTRPRLLLMDEPFAALDEFTRQRLNADLLAWWQAQGLALIFVTHSVFEAVFLSQRVVVMGARPGRVVAEIRVDEAFPRAPGFRTSSAYLQACRAVTQALESAHARPVRAR